MLNLMRKHAGSWMIKIILFAISVVFVFWGVGSMRTRQATRVAEVNGEVISLDVYQQAYYQLLDNYRNIYGDQLNDDMLKLLRPNEQALEQLIQRVLMLQEAERLDIDVSKAELAESIRQTPSFQSNGTFSIQRYRQILAQNNLAVEQFEADRLSSLRLQRLQAAVIAGVTVSEDEIQQWYNHNKATVDIRYAFFPASRYTDIAPSDDEIKAYFEANQKRYLTEPEINARYIVFDPADYAEQVAVSDTDIADYYHANPAEFKTEKRVNARHILITMDAGASEDEVALKKKEIDAIYQKAVAEGADFEALARQYSQDRSSAQGGLVGWFTKERVTPAFGEKAFSMKPGEVSEPVRTPFGWHIIKVEDVAEATSKTLAQASDTIRTAMIAKASRSLAMDKAEEVYNSVFDGDNLADAAVAHGVPVQETGFIKANASTVKGISEPQQFVQTAVGLEMMAISEIQELGKTLVILQVAARNEAVVPPFEQVKERAKADLISKLQDERAQKDADAMLEDVKTGTAFRAAGDKFDVGVKETGLFSRAGAIPQIGLESRISQEAFALSKEKPLPDSALKGAQGWYVIAFKSRTLPEKDGLEKERETIASQLERQKKQTAMQAWLAELRARSAIEVNDTLIQN